MWYKDEAAGSHTFCARSDDLYRWDVLGPAITDCSHEGPNVFFWKGAYWMITDHWKGLGVYRSEDAEHWIRQENILDRPGTRQDDGYFANHADVLVSSDRAFIFYFVHPGRAQKPAAADDMPYSHRRSSLQVAELELHSGVLCCQRDREFSLDLTAPD
jgi:hypothetical protein